VNRRLLAALILAAVALLTAGCHVQLGYPHACDNHGGTRVWIKGMNYCNDGTSVGDGWLWLHHLDRAP
jgi:hypothetical protein